MGVIVVAFGLVVGSFLNVCIDRLPAGKSILGPRSHCPACKTTLAARELVPVLSYVLLRGRCRHCSAPIPTRVLVVEAVTGTLYLLLWGLWGASLLFLLTALAASVLFALLVAVYEQQAGRVRKPSLAEMRKREVSDGLRR